MAEVIDCRGLACPMPVVQLAKKIKIMNAGEEVELLADAPGSKTDVPAWCRRTGNTLVEFRDHGGSFSYLVRKSE